MQKGVRNLARKRGRNPPKRVGATPQNGWAQCQAECAAEKRVGRSQNTGGPQPKTGWAQPKTWVGRGATRGARSSFVLHGDVEPGDAAARAAEGSLGEYLVCSEGAEPLGERCGQG